MPEDLLRHNITQVEPNEMITVPAAPGGPEAAVSVMIVPGRRVVAKHLANYQRVI
jgi:hypothetical protein